MIDFYAQRLRHREDDENQILASFATEELADKEVESNIDEEDQNEAS